MEKRYVVGLGEALWDVLPEGKKLGGAPANFAYHVGLFLGQENTLAVSALGEDALAAETEAALDEHGLSYLMPRDGRGARSRPGRGLQGSVLRHLGAAQ